MTIGRILYVVAAVLFFLGAIGSTVIPNPSTWGLFCIALGLSLGNVELGSLRRR